MPVLEKLLLPIALLVGACNSDEADAPATAEVEAAAPADADPSDRDARALAKFAKLDVNSDGSLTTTELDGHKLAVLFAEFDADGNDLLSTDEFVAAKRAHRGGKSGKHGKRGKHERGKRGERPDAENLAPNQARG